MPRLMPTPYRHPKTSIFWIKGANPPDILTISGKKQYRRSLGTADSKQVKAAYARTMLALEAEWEAARAGPRSLNQRQITALSGEEYRRLLAKHGDEPGEAPMWKLIAALMDYGARPGADITWDFTAIDSLITGRGIASIDETTRQRLNMALAQSTAQGARQLARQADGNYTQDENATRFPEWPKAGITISALYDLWKAIKRPADDTARQWLSMTNQFSKFTGTTEAASVTKAHIEGWRDHLRERGIGAKRIKEGYIASLRSIFETAVDDGKLASNPAKGVKVHVPKTIRGRSKGFTDEEARLILRAAMGPHEGRHNPDTRAAYRWVPWLCAYTGARVAEVTQLRKEDLKQERGIYGILITPDAGSTKSGQSRLVPLHPHLIEQGFVTFVNSQKAGPLFYDASRALREVHRAHKTRAEGMAEWVRKIGVKDLAVAPNHGWRHRFKTEARRAGMDTEIRDYIQGHAPRTEGEDYGDQPLDVTYPAIALLPRYVLDESEKATDGHGSPPQVTP